MRRGRRLQVAPKLPTISSAIQAKLRSARVARLATLDAGNRPHLVPVCFVYDSGIFYSAVDRKPKQVTANKLVRVRNIRKTSKVALLIDRYDEDWNSRRDHRLFLAALSRRSDPQAQGKRRNRSAVGRAGSRTPSANCFRGYPGGAAATRAGSGKHGCGLGNLHLQRV